MSISAIEFNKPADLFDPPAKMLNNPGLNEII